MPSPPPTLPRGYNCPAVAGQVGYVAYFSQYAACIQLSLSLVPPMCLTAVGLWVSLVLLR